MKQQVVSPARERTRRAILEAVADVVTDTSGVGFTVQAVADRAGVSHRTVYNHFPTRDALCEAFAAYVDEVLLATGAQPPDRRIDVPSMPGMVDALYRVLGQRDRYARAYVMLMLANRAPMKAWRGRTRTFETLLASHASAGAAIDPRLVAAAIRVFASSVGWHLLTEQIGLSTEEAARAGAWATQALLDAVNPNPAPPASRRPAAARNPRTRKA
ncbi:MAG: TetR/AcrR family transcriptional regulator [Vicinamibacterales bacterium]